MRADDEGFVSSPKRILRAVGCAEDDMKLLIAKGFVIPFESGVCVIVHWRQNNSIQSDRFKKSLYSFEKSMLSMDENKLYTRRIQTVSIMDTQSSLGKDSIDKGSREIYIVDSDAKLAKSTKREIDDFFESVWALYPEKKGKGQISDAKKRVLFGIGFEEISRCVVRYKADKPDWKKYQNGSTFFNSGYVDYLDANYVPSQGETSPAPTRHFVKTGTDDVGMDVGYWEGDSSAG